MPTGRANCGVCGADHAPALPASSSAPGAGGTCPYGGMPYADLRAGHDQLYFGRWRRTDATAIDIRQARRGLERLLRAIASVLDTEDVPAGRRDLNKAFEALYSMGSDAEGPRDLLLMDNALSYAHRVIGDLLHEKGLPPHHPADFAAWHDAGEIPFRDEW